MTSAAPALVCTGFHRSLTSLTAKRLHEAGLPLGAHLVPAHPSNPDGHFEDQRIVDIDDAWLARQRSDWLFHDEVPLPADDVLAADLRAYVAHRDEAATAWAVKDPRISLALPEWDAVLGERGRYVLMVRHWAECAQSLFHRHGRELAHQLPGPLPARSPHLRPWLQPDVAYRSWLAYNRRVLEFAAAHPGRVAIVTARAMAGMASLAPLVVERLGVAVANPEPAPGLRSGLLSAVVDEALLPPPPLWQRRCLDGLWTDLLALAAFRTDDEDTQRSSRRLPAWIRAGIDAAVGARFPEAAAATVPSATPAPAASAAPATTLALLELVPIAQRGPRALAAARAAFVAGRLDDAEAVLQAGLAAGATPYALRLLLGDVHTQRLQHEAALAEYQEALRTRVTDSGVLKTARCLKALARWQDALDLLEPLLERTPDHHEALLARARCLDRLAGPDRAAASLRAAPAPDPALLTTRAHLTMSVDLARGLREYDEAVRQRLADRDLVGWLATVNVAVASPAAWDALVEALVRHWRDVLGESLLQRRLALPALPDPREWTATAAGLAPVAIGSLCARDAVGLAGTLAALGWQLGTNRDGDDQDLDFERHLAPLAGTAIAADSGEWRAALSAFLGHAADELANREPPARGWGWAHAATAWLAAPLLAALPDLHYVHVRADADAAWSPGADAGLLAWGRAVLGRDDVAPTPYWRLKYWVALHRQVDALARDFPQRVSIYDPARAARTPAHLHGLLETLGVADPAELATLPAPRRPLRRPPPAADAAVFDPLDLEYAREHGGL